MLMPEVAWIVIWSGYDCGGGGGTIRGGVVVTVPSLMGAKLASVDWWERGFIPQCGKWG